MQTPVMVYNGQLWLPSLFKCTVAFCTHLVILGRYRKRRGDKPERDYMHLSIVCNQYVLYCKVILILMSILRSLELLTHFLSCTVAIFILWHQNNFVCLSKSVLFCLLTLSCSLLLLSLSSLWVTDWLAVRCLSLSSSYCSACLFLSYSLCLANPHEVPLLKCD